MKNADFVQNLLHEQRDYFASVSEYLFAHPETRFEEYESAAWLIAQCERQGFTVSRAAGGIETAFVASYGSGAPVIAFLGEYDALAGLGQVANVSTRQATPACSNGHGCGHNLLGTGAFAAACAVKAWLEERGLPGTVKFFGCPGEEGGSGKTFMVRAGVFDGVDAALTWHPSPANAIMSLSTLANYQVAFHFQGIPSHAANSPHLGRSALDAVELMNVGVQYLREHIIPAARVHYAVTNSGGISPNVVQAEAEVLYLIRAPQVAQVEEIYQRIIKIAQGAALMTETSLTVKFDKACSNYIPNRALERLLHASLQTVGVAAPTPAEVDVAAAIRQTLSEGERAGALDVMRSFGYHGDGHEFAGKHLADSISPYVASEAVMAGSTDVADVSWVAPTAQLTTSTAALGTALHTWQMTAQGISSNAHKAMLRAAAAMADTALTLLEDTGALQAVRAEFAAFRAENPYHNPIPADVQPSKLK